MMNVTARVNLSPLRPEQLAPAIDRATRTFQEFGLDVVSGPMGTTITGDDEALFAGLQRALRAAAEQEHGVMHVTFSGARSARDTTETVVAYEAIGHVENAFDEPDTPATIAAAESRIVLKPALAQGLSGLETGQQIMVLFHFDRTQDYELRQHPRGDINRPRRGVFALRSPRRPTPIGVTVVELLALEDNVLRVRGLDALNGSPVLDLKPA